MAYSIHIERESSDIQLEEWISTIESIEGARISTSDTKIINPATGEEIIIRSNPGDVEVHISSGGILGFAKKYTWVNCIFYSNGKATFKASADIDSPKNMIHIVVSTAAKLLSAQIVGDEGEVYKW